MAQSPRHRRRVPWWFRPDLRRLACLVPKFLLSGGGWLLSTGRGCVHRVAAALHRAAAALRQAAAALRCRAALGDVGARVIEAQPAGPKKRRKNRRGRHNRTARPQEKGPSSPGGDAAPRKEGLQEGEGSTSPRGEPAGPTEPSADHAALLECSSSLAEVSCGPASPKSSMLLQEASSSSPLHDEEGWELVRSKKKKKQKQQLEKGMGKRKLHPEVSAFIPPQGKDFLGKRRWNTQQPKLTLRCEGTSRGHPKKVKLIKDEGYGIDLLFAEEAGDPEMERHGLYSRDVSRCKGFTLCLICYLSGSKKKIENDNEKMKGHCDTAHQGYGIMCNKRGCIARAKTKRDIGLHEYVCHRLKKRLAAGGPWIA